MNPLFQLLATFAMFLVAISLFITTILILSLIVNFIADKMGITLSDPSLDPHSWVAQSSDAIPPDSRCRVLAGANVGTEVIVCWMAGGWNDTYFVERVETGTGSGIEGDSRYGYESGCDLEIIDIKSRKGD